MKLELFKQIVERLNTELNKKEIVSQFRPLNYIARYRGQFDDPQETLPKLCIAVEFSSIEYENKAKGIQEAEFQVKIHVYWRSLDQLKLGKTVVEGTQSLEYLIEVNRVLHGWSPVGFDTMSRISEEDNNAYENKTMDVLIYETKAEDCSADKRRNYEEVEIGLNVEEGETPEFIESETPYKFKT